MEMMLCGEMEVMSMSRLQKNPFTEYAVEYDAWFDKYNYTYLSEVELFKKFVPKHQVGLEIGVGTGRFAEPLGVNYGIDVASEMIEIAKKKGLNVSLASSDNIPFEDNSLDYILLTTTICFLDNIERAFDEIYRVLKSDGFLILGFVDKQSFLGQSYLKKKDKSKFYENARFYSVAEILSFLKKYSFADIEIKQTLFSLPEEIGALEPILDGFGKGGFVAIKATKK